MLSPTTRAITRLLGTVALALSAAVAVDAQTTFSVDPLLIEITAETRNVVMTLTNTSSRELRFEIKAYAWDQRPPNGSMDLTPTGDVVIFPPLVTVKPRSIQRVRIGTTVAQAVIEKAYRVMIEELPSGAVAPAGAQVAVRTRVGVPVFLAALKPARSGRIDAVTIDKAVVSIPLTNTGTTHAIVDDIVVRGMSGPDDVVFEDTLKGWYVLAGKSRTWTYTIQAAQCRLVKFLEIDVSSDDKTLTRKVDMPAGSCRR